MRPAAFLFDLDGTLVDTESAWAGAMADYIVSKGGRTTADELLPRIVGRNWLDIHAEIHRMFPSLGDSSPAEDAAALRGFYAKHAADPESMKIESSIKFFLKAAFLAPCAIVSGSPHDDVVAAAKLCGIADATALVLGAGEYPRGKPFPDGYLAAARMLGVSPADCVVVEDSAVGVASGAAAGMRVIALDRNAALRQSFEGETWKVEDLSEFDFAGEFAA